MLTQALMGSQTLSIGLHIFDLKDGDRFILCSDGLSGVLTDKEIKTLAKSPSPKDAVAALVDATYINGAPDNVTVIVSDIEDGEPAESTIEFFGTVAP
jgi:serine/threonine protein phosphatase PrpC